MSATPVRSTPTSPAAPELPGRSAPSAILRPIFIALGVFMAIGGIGLGITLITGATAVFNILVFTLFTVLWIAFAAALIFSPRTLDDVWHLACALPPVVQGVAGLLFLPIAIGLWIWERAWSLPIRLILVTAIGVWNLFLFFPRG